MCVCAYVYVHRCTRETWGSPTISACGAAPHAGVCTTYSACMYVHVCMFIDVPMYTCIYVDMCILIIHLYGRLACSGGTSRSPGHAYPTNDGRRRNDHLRFAPAGERAGQTGRAPFRRHFAWENAGAAPLARICTTDVRGGRGAAPHAGDRGTRGVAPFLSYGPSPHRQTPH